jgi:hypothetical protein
MNPAPEKKDENILPVPEPIKVPKKRGRKPKIPKAEQQVFRIIKGEVIINFTT